MALALRALRPTARHVSAIATRPTRNISTIPNMRQTWRKHPSTAIGIPEIHSFFEPDTQTWQYLVVDPASSEAVLVDPVLDYNPASGTLSSLAADEILDFISKNGLKVKRIMETHAHADHLTASQYYKKRLGRDVLVCIGSRITQVQERFAPKYGFQSKDFENTFDIYLRDEEVFSIGSIACRVIHLPGHTPDHVGYAIGDAVFTGDSIFMPDVGSARADFPGGNAQDLYASMQKLLSLPPSYRLFVGHDYPLSERGEQEVATVGDHLERNKHCKSGVEKDEFIKFREARDAALGTPRLLHPSLQFNIRAGKLPPLNQFGQRVITIPLKQTELLDCLP